VTRSRRSRAEPGSSDERGAAVVDFVLVSLVLLPLVLGLVQVALVLHVRNTLTAAATEGARYAATVDRQPQDGVARTRAQIAGALADRFAGDVVAADVEMAGVPTVEVRVHATVPPLGLWGPGVSLDVAGHAVRESVPEATP
jgi:Flp pilus assembly protein TadG